MVVIGIDFGNSKCVVSLIKQGEIKIVTNEVSNRKTPSMVAYGEGMRSIGESAVGQQSRNYDNTIDNIKCLIGADLDSPETKELMRDALYKLTKSEAGRAAVEISYDGEKQTLEPESVLASLISHLKLTSFRYMDGAPCTDCVIGVPSYFTDVQRRAILDAASIAGMNCLGLLNENTAVAVQYGLLRKLPKEKPINVIFYDSGHTQTSASLVSLIDGKLEVLAVASDKNLGGKHFDKVVFDEMSRIIQEKYKLNVRENPKAFLRLLSESEKIKKTLSANSDVVWGMECFMNDVDVSGEFDRTQLESLAQPLLDRVCAPLESLLKHSGLKLADIDAVEVVGGTTRIPSVVSRLEKFLGRPVSKTCDGDESVARGCALQGAMLSPKFKVNQFTIHDVTPYPIDVVYGSLDGKIEGESTMFKRFNPIPSLKIMSFHRTEPLALTLRYNAEANLPEGTNPFIGRFVVAGHASKSEKPPKIKVKIALDISGVATVRGAQAIDEVVVEAQEETMKVEETPKEDERTEETSEAPPQEEASETTQPKLKKTKTKTDLNVTGETLGGFSETKVQSEFEREAKMAHQDQIIRETLALKNNLESYILEIRDRVDLDLAEYSPAEERENFLNQLMDIEDWLYGDGSNAQKSEYVAKLGELKSTGTRIAARQFEHLNREAAIDMIKKLIFHLDLEAQNKENKLDHIPTESLESVSKKCKETDSWLIEKIVAQKNLSKDQDALLTCAMIQKAASDLEKFCRPILDTPRPKPKVETPPETEVKPETESKPGADSAAGDMEVDETPKEEPQMEVD